MKDYTLFAWTKHSNKNFILGYEIIDDKLVVELTDGKKYLVPFNEENEKIILSRMEAQAMNSYKMYPVIRRRMLLSSSVLPIMAMFITINIYNLSSGISTIPWINWTAISAFSLGLLVNITTIVEGIRTKNDMKKNDIFLDEKEKLNNNIRRESIKNIVSKKTALLIDATPENKPVFDINSIDYMSLSELKRISDSIHQYLSFGFNDDFTKTEVEHEKGATKVFRPNNK